MPNHQGAVERYHNNFSWLSRAIGIPCLAAEVCAVLDYPVISQVRSILGGGLQLSVFHQVFIIIIISKLSHFLSVLSLIHRASF